MLKGVEPVNTAQLRGNVHNQNRFETNVNVHNQNRAHIGFKANTMQVIDRGRAALATVFPDVPPHIRAHVTR